ncbi:MAG TPA: hypothetical protein VGP07_10510 [Polyangia bacterium]|jgi:hypothetical protein
MTTMTGNAGTWATRIALALSVAFAFTTSACSSSRACRAGTALLSVTLGEVAASARQLDVEVSLDGLGASLLSFPSQAGRPFKATESLEIGIPQYATHTNITVTVIARDSTQAEVARVVSPVTPLSPSCLALAVSFGGGTGVGGGAGAAGGSAAGGIGGESGTAGAGGAGGGAPGAGGVGGGGTAGAGGGGDPCVGKTCGTPPASVCFDPTHLKAYDTVGSCAAGSCVYSSQMITCSCVGNACTADPCSTVTCSTPPAASCVNGTTRRTFAATGSCGGGSCTYASSDSPCAFGCAGGACLTDPCATVTCDTPPASTCAGTLKRTFAATGTCTSGICSYAPTDAPCPSPQTCGGGSTAGVCGCIPAPLTTTCAGKSCGPVTDSCGAAATCPNNCSSTQVCGGGTAGANGCCTPEPLATTCQDITTSNGYCTLLGKNERVNNCGVTVSCAPLCNGCCTTVTTSQSLGWVCCAHGTSCGGTACP